MRTLIDINVLVDFLTLRKSFYDDASQIIYLATTEKITAIVPTHTVTTLYYLLHQANHSDKKTRKKMKILFDTVLIAETTRSDCLWALQSPIKDYEDGVIVETAARENIDVIITRNTKDFKKSAVPVMTPKEFLKKYQFTG